MQYLQKLKMSDNSYVLGIDTSNYKTSVALVDSSGSIIYNHRQFLNVKKGERGLRQSEALFQHVQNLPGIISEAVSLETRSHIKAVAVSDRPRPLSNSYMPVFTAGRGCAEIISASLGVPLYTFSHQEGHIEAVKYYSQFKDSSRLICFHFSGGTTEAVLYENKSNLNESDISLRIIGGSRDLAFGQVLDRTGVAMGYEFPCGDVIDRLAVIEASEHKPDKSLLTKVKVHDGFINLSGIETQAARAVECTDQNILSHVLMYRLSEAVAAMTLQLSEKYNISDFLYAGGFSCSDYMRSFLSSTLPQNINIAFGNPALSSDNAVGTALLGGKFLWR